MLTEATDSRLQALSVLCCLHPLVTTVLDGCSKLSCWWPPCTAALMPPASQFLRA